MLTPEKVKAILTEFIEQKIPNLLGDIQNEKARDELLYYLKLLAFSHEHKKHMSFLEIEDPEKEFAIIRDPMYKYSHKAKDTFFRQPTLSFIFLWFATNP